MQLLNYCGGGVAAGAAVVGGVVIVAAIAVTYAVVATYDLVVKYKDRKSIEILLNRLLGASDKEWQLMLKNNHMIDSRL